MSNPVQQRRFLLLGRPSLHVAMAALASVTIACGAPASDASDDSAGALSVTPPAVPALRAKITECPQLADPTARLTCISNANTAEISVIDAAADSNYPNKAVTDFPLQMDSFRDSEQRLCHALAGLEPTSEVRSPSIDACLATRELSLAKVILQTFYKYDEVAISGPLSAKCPKPAIVPATVDPNNTLLARREESRQEALLGQWSDCYRSAIRNDNAAIDYAVNWAVNICSAIANGAYVGETHEGNMAQEECEVLSLYLLQQDIERK